MSVSKRSKLSLGSRFMLAACLLSPCFLPSAPSAISNDVAVLGSCAFPASPFFNRKVCHLNEEVSLMHDYHYGVEVETSSPPPISWFSKVSSFFFSMEMEVHHLRAYPRFFSSSPEIDVMIDNVVGGFHSLLSVNVADYADIVSVVIMPTIDNARNVSQTAVHQLCSTATSYIKAFPAWPLVHLPTVTFHDNVVAGVRDFVSVDFVEYTYSYSALMLSTVECALGVSQTAFHQIHATATSYINDLSAWTLDHPATAYLHDNVVAGYRYFVSVNYADYAYNISALMVSTVECALGVSKTVFHQLYSSATNFVNDHPAGDLWTFALRDNVVEGYRSLLSVNFTDYAYSYFALMIPTIDHALDVSKTVFHQLQTAATCYINNLAALTLNHPTAILRDISSAIIYEARVFLRCWLSCHAGLKEQDSHPTPSSVETIHYVFLINPPASFDTPAAPIINRVTPTFKTTSLASGFGKSVVVSSPRVLHPPMFTVPTTLDPAMAPGGRNHSLVFDFNLVAIAIMLLFSTSLSAIFFQMQVSRIVEAMQFIMQQTERTTLLHDNRLALLQDELALVHDKLRELKMALGSSVSSDPPLHSVFLAVFDLRASSCFSTAIRVQIHRGFDGVAMAVPGSLRHLRTAAFRNFSCALLQSILNQTDNWIDREILFNSMVPWAVHGRVLLAAPECTAAFRQSSESSLSLRRLCFEAGWHPTMLSPFPRPHLSDSVISYSPVFSSNIAAAPGFVTRIKNTSQWKRLVVATGTTIAAAMTLLVSFYSPMPTKTVSLDLAQVLLQMEPLVYEDKSSRFQLVSSSNAPVSIRSGGLSNMTLGLTSALPSTPLIFATAPAANATVDNDPAMRLSSAFTELDDAFLEYWMFGSGRISTTGRLAHIASNGLKDYETVKAEDWQPLLADGFEKQVPRGICQKSRGQVVLYVDANKTTLNVRVDLL